MHYFAVDVAGQRGGPPRWPPVRGRPPPPTIVLPVNHDSGRRPSAVRHRVLLIRARLVQSRNHILRRRAGMGVFVDEVEALLEPERRAHNQARAPVVDRSAIVSTSAVTSPWPDDRVEAMLAAWRERCPIYLALLQSIALSTSMSGDGGSEGCASRLEREGVLARRGLAAWAAREASRRARAAADRSDSPTADRRSATPLIMSGRCQSNCPGVGLGLRPSTTRIEPRPITSMT